MQIIGDALEERLLHLDGAACIQRDLDQQDVLRVAVAEITAGDVDLVGRMLGDDLEFVVLGHVDDFPHRIVDDFAGLLAERGWLAPDEVDADERHGILLVRRRAPSDT